MMIDRGGVCRSRLFFKHLALAVGAEVMVRWRQSVRLGDTQPFEAYRSERPAQSEKFL
jgi:hypothetical protein